jgi:hypothetical protein
LAVVVALGGCGGGSGAVPTPAEGGGAGNTVDSGGPGYSSSATDAQGAGVIVYFSVEGGYGNLARSIAIAEGGAVEVERGGKPTSDVIGKADLEAIVTDLNRSGLFDRNREYPPPTGAADLQRFEIRYAGATIVAYDTTVPAELADVVARLDQLIAAG